MLEDGTIIDVLRLIIGAIILFIASYTDIKTRRASNMLWIIMGSVGAILLIVQYFTVGFENIIYLIFIPILIGLWYVLFQLRLIFGGADAKALMALAILAPITPHILDFPIWVYALPFSFVIFANAVILFLFIPLSLLVYNAAKGNIEFPFCFVGYKMSLEKAKQSFIWPCERIVNGKRKFSYLPSDFDVEAQLKVFEIKGIDEIWVTPKVPFMIPLLAGFITAFFLGDIMSHFVQIITALL
jgi:preflagellin peptidase FlaK